MQPQLAQLTKPRLPQLGETLGLQRRQHSRYIGLSSPFDSLLIGLSQFDTRNESPFDLGTLRRVNDHECFIMLPDENTQDYAGEADALDLVEQLVHPHGPALLELYFQVVHPSYPILQKHLFVERYRSGDRSFSPALLAGMYILALNWWSRNPELASYSKPDAARLEAIAMKALTTAMERPKLSTVQAGLLLLQRPEADSWSLTTQLVAIGQELGLHLDCSSWSVPSWEYGLRKRIAWALYMQDKWSSLIHGRPSHIFNANWAVKPITEDDFDERGDGYDTRHEETEDEQEENSRGRILFAQIIGLTQIMSEVMDTFYTQTAIQDFANAGKKSTELILARAKPVQIKLRQWHEKLPAEVKMQASGKGQLTSTGNVSRGSFRKYSLTVCQATYILHTLRQKSHSIAASYSRLTLPTPTRTASSCAAMLQRRVSFRQWTLSIGLNPSTSRHSGSSPQRSTLPSLARLDRFSGLRRPPRRRQSFTNSDCTSTAGPCPSRRSAQISSITPSPCWTRVAPC